MGLVVVFRFLAARRLLQLSDERVRKREVQCDSNTDHGDSIKQRYNQEHFGLQHRRQLRLPCSAFEEAAAQKAHADTYAQCAKADQNRDGNRGLTNYSFHQFLQLRILSKVINALQMRDSNKQQSTS